MNSSKIKKSVQSRKKLSGLFNPFPGIRPFTINESHLFFGREGQSDEVLNKLALNRFVAVIGASGSGKSSLMYCGLLPTLYGGFIANAGSQWKTVVARPGSSPIENLAEGLANSLYSPEEFDREKNVIDAILRSNSKGLAQAIGHAELGKQENILIMIDQFEELFRYKKNTIGDSGNEAVAFVRLLIEAIDQSEIPIYVVMTMRSDFIGDCAQFPNLTQKINYSHYLIPQMTRENLRDAIVGPVAVGGGTISSRLVEELLNSIGDNPDQLPILQHALMRTWAYWEMHHTQGEPMDIQHYDAIGRMETALSQHANEAFDELSEDEKILCERIFKNLTEKGADNRGIRHPSRIKELMQITEASFDDIASVVDRFRMQGRSFLMPSYELNLTQDTILDISHESLMRVWDRLKAWVEDESQSIQMYMRLARAAELFQAGKTGLWRPPDLQLAAQWKEKQKPNLAWAVRYDVAFERAMIFLKASIDEYELEEQNKLLHQRRALRRTRVFALVLGAATILSLGTMIYAITQKQEAENRTLEALTLREEAETQRSLAIHEKELAEQARLEANEQRELALANAEKASKNAELARLQTLLAEQKAIEADQQRRIAERKTREAEISAQQAALSAQEAMRQKEEAERQRSLAQESSDQALRLRMLSISQSMAVKSLQINRDTTRKALIAYQAYQFNNEFGGSANNPDVYDGLYYALKALKNSEYNSLEGHKGAVKSMVYGQGYTMYSAGSDGQILKWNTKTSTTPQETIYDENGQLIRVIAVSPNENYLVAGLEDGDLLLFDMSGDNKKPFRLKGHRAALWQAVFTKENTLFTASADSTVRMWQINKENLSNTFSETKYSGSRVRGIALDKKRNRLALTTESGKLIWHDAEKGDKISEVSPEGFKSGIYAIALGNTGELMALGDRFGNVRVYKQTDNTLITTLEGQNARVNQLLFSKNDSKLASASFDGSVQMWQTKDLNAQPIVLKDHDSWVWSVAFSPESDKLVAGCVDRLIRVWPTGMDVMANEFCDKIGRNMTQAEWNRYVAEDIAYKNTCNSLPAGEGTKK